MKPILYVTLLALLLSGCGSLERSLPADTVPAVQTTQVSLPETVPPTTEAVTQPQQERFVLTFAGDCTFGCSVDNMYAGYGFIKAIGQDYRFPFANVADYFAQDDFSFVNLEGVLADSGSPVGKRFAFRGPTHLVNILPENSVEMVSLGNNHTMDYGPTAYQTTKDTLDQAQVSYVERDSSCLYTTSSGLTIGVYAMTYHLLDVEDMAAEIAQLRQQGAQVVIVAPHWGVELTYQPTPQQVEVGHAAIDAGADLVVGSHPHVLQPIEEYGGGIIFYSLANFVFGGNIYPQDYDSALIQQEVIRDSQGVHLGQTTIVPVNVSSLDSRNNFQPTPYQPGTPEYQRVLSKLDGSFSGPRLSPK